MKRQRMVVTVCCGLILFGLIAFFPLPHSVRCSIVLELVAAQNVFVEEAGVVKSVNATAGTSVEKGDTIAVLENIDIAISLEQLNGQLLSLQARLKGLQFSNKAYDGSRMITETKLQITDIENRIRLIKERQTALTLVATRDGVVIDPPNVPDGTDQGEQIQLAGWSGSPLDDKNRNAFMERGSLFCVVGNPSEMQATLVIDESVAKFVDADQPVELMLDEYAGEVLEGKIQSVSRKPMNRLPRELALENGGPVASEPIGNGEFAPLIASYEATVVIDDPGEMKLKTGFRGQAKIRVGSMSIGKRALRYLQSIVNFR